MPPSGKERGCFPGEAVYTSVGLDNLQGISSASLMMPADPTFLSFRFKAPVNGMYDVFGTLRSPKILHRIYSFMLKYKTSRDAALETMPGLPNRERNDFFTSFRSISLCLFCTKRVDAGRKYLIISSLVLKFFTRLTILLSVCSLQY